MPRMTKLSDDEITRRLATLDGGWELQKGKLHRELRFAGFAEAFGFMASVAVLAQGMDHHPEWFNVYNRVVIDLCTHDAGGISENDFALAARVDELARGRTR
jgi:4a-hydroxytetrahydrobiopterin dehydratase